MSRDDDDLPETPKCLFCARRREGRRYRLWGGFHISTEATRQFLSNVVTVKSKYRDLKRSSYYACRPCAQWAVRWAAAPTIGSVLAIAACFLIGCVWVPDKERYPKIGMGIAAGLVGLLAVALIVQALLPDTDSTNHDESLRDLATRRLKAKGRGDTYFTEDEYKTLFLNKTCGPETTRHQTAAEILSNHDDGDDGDDEDDDRPTRRRRK